MTTLTAEHITALTEHYTAEEIADLAAKGIIARRPKWATDIVFFRVDWETYFKLRQLKRWYWDTVRLSARFKRWQSGRMSYRSADEPKVCPHFNAFALSGPECCAYTLWLEEVRHPVALQQCVCGEPPKSWHSVHQDRIAMINQMYVQVRDWYIAERGEADPFTLHEQKKQARASSIKHLLG